ncbi:MAG: copper ion binding protein, partial [Clostridiales bacterium]|nr:copper ion binding protein [Clostridiales bacterium]
MRNETLKISGMSCAACAKRVEKVVGGLEGVENAYVNLASEKLSVDFDSNKASINNIKKVIESAGYGVIDDIKLNSITIPIEGMTCAVCAMRIEKTLSGLEGVEKASVNLATEKAMVEYNSQKVRPVSIRQAIEKLGYKALQAERGEIIDEEKIRKEKAVKILWRKFIVSAVFAVPLLYLSMGSMIWWLPFPIPEILNPMQYP